MSFVSRYLEPALLERLNHLQLTARRVVEGSTVGQHKSPLKGASVEFRQHRPYVVGDEPRRLDWRVLARTNKPFIKEFDEETNLRCMLILDCSGSMAYGEKSGTKFEYAAKLIASLAYLMLGQTESVGLALVGKKIEQWVPPSGAPSQLSRIIDTLERATPKGEASISAAAHEASGRLGRRGLVIVVSDFFSPANLIRSGLAHLHHDRHEIICLRVLDQNELEFPFRNWSRFRGLESEAPRLCEPAVIRKTYLANFNRHREELERACRSVSAECQTFVTEKPIVDSLTQFLNRRATRG